MTSKALAASDRALNLDPAYAPTHWRRGYWLLDLGRIDQAEQSFRNSLSAIPRPRRLGSAWLASHWRDSSTLRTSRWSSR